MCTCGYLACVPMHEGTEMCAVVHVCVCVCAPEITVIPQDSVHHFFKDGISHWYLALTGPVRLVGNKPQESICLPLPMAGIIHSYN